MNDILHAFPGQGTDEPVFVFARSYPVAFLPTALVFLIIFAFSVLSQYVVATNLLVPFTTEQANAGILFLGAFQLLVLVIFLAAVLDFYYDLIVVTDRRLVEVDQELLFFRRISELPLEEVEDVTSLTEGFLSDVFGYGTVEVQTAGTEDKFIATNIYAPREVTAIILNLSEQVKKGTPQDTSRPRPTTPTLAVINNQPITSQGGLEAAGGVPPTPPPATPPTNANS